MGALSWVGKRQRRHRRGPKPHKGPSIPQLLCYEEKERGKSGLKKPREGGGWEWDKKPASNEQNRKKKKRKKKKLGFWGDEKSGVEKGKERKNFSYTTWSKVPGATTEGRRGNRPRTLPKWESGTGICADGGRGKKKKRCGFVNHENGQGSKF